LSRITRLGREGVACPWWLCFTFDNPLRRWIHPPQTILNGLVRPGETAMDLGCGMGYFTLAMAGLVGEHGKVIAVDLQERMLAGVRRRAEQADLTSRIRVHQCRPDTLDLDERVDFILAFWMLHEVRDRLGLLQELRQMVTPHGRLLLVEPVLHVHAWDFRASIGLTRQAGFASVEVRSIRFSHAVLLEAALPQQEGNP